MDKKYYNGKGNLLTNQESIDGIHKLSDDLGVMISWCMKKIKNRRWRLRTTIKIKPVYLFSMVLILFVALAYIASHYESMITILFTGIGILILMVIFSKSKVN